MNTPILRDFARQVATDGITKENAKKVISLLSIRDLQIFKRLLSQELEKKTVYITVSEELDNYTDKKLEDLFKNKRIVRNVDSKIGGGINARVYDMIYDLSVKSSIEKIVAEAQEEL